MEIATVRAGPPYSDRSDDALMELTAAGSAEAYEALVRRHQATLRAYCARYCGSATVGDDVAQECFVEIWQRRATYQQRGKFKSYLFHVAANRCKNALRKRGREAGLRGLPQPDEIQIEQSRHELDRLLDKLPDSQREAILLRYSAELGYREIADLLGTPEPTVRSRVFAGLAKLRQLLKIERRK